MPGKSIRTSPAIVLFVLQSYFFRSFRPATRIMPVPSKISELGSGTVGGVAATVPVKLAVPPWLTKMVSIPFMPKAPERPKRTGAPVVEQACTGGAVAGFWQKGVTSATPVPGTRPFPVSPHAVNASPTPVVAAAVVKVPDWLADRVSGLPAGNVKLFSAALTTKVVAPADTLVTAVLVSNVKACDGVPGELPWNSTSVTVYPPTAPPKKSMVLLCRLVEKPAVPQAVTLAAVSFWHVRVVAPLDRLKKASAFAAGL